MANAENHGASPSLALRARHELIQFAVISLYLYICFGALLFYKSSILASQGINYAPYGVAIIKALILGKFVLIGHAMKIGEGRLASILLLRILWKSLTFLLLLVVLTLIEEGIAGLIHHRGVEEILQGIAGGTLIQALATALLMLLVMIPYFAFREISIALGEGTLLRLLIARGATMRTAETSVTGT